jgi:hypothetical protein
LSGDASARNARVSSAVGSLPIVSRYELVDYVVSLRVGEGFARHVRIVRRDDDHVDDLARVPHGHGARAVADHLHAALVVDRGNGFAGGCELRPRRHIAHRAVVELRSHYNALLIAGTKHRLGGERFERLDHRVLITGRRGALGDPLR